MHPAFFSIPALGQKAPLISLPAGLDAFALAQLAQQHSAPIFVLTVDTASARRLQTEIAFFAPTLSIALLPDWETLPYDRFSPHNRLISERLQTLWKIRQGQCNILLLPVNTAMTRLCPITHLLGNTFLIKVKDLLGIETFRHDLIASGYQAVTQVMAPGEFSVRGHLVDVFPMGSTLPFRIDLFDDEVESLRTFNPDTQRTLFTVPEIHLLPAHEYPTDKESITHFRQRYREHIEGDPSKSRIYKDVSAGLWPAGIEYYLPLFFDEMATVFDYVGKEALFIFHHNVLEAAQGFWQDIEQAYTMVRSDPDRPVLPPSSLFLRPDEIMAALKPYARLPIQSQADTNSPLLPPLAVERRAEQPLQRLAAFIAQNEYRILLTAESIGRRETIFEFLQQHGIRPTLVKDWNTFIHQNERLALTVSPLLQGFIIDDIAVITESELYQHVARHPSQRTMTKANRDTMLRDLAEIKDGDLIVHEQHGIGRYIGLMAMDLGEGQTEMMQLEYQDQAMLYVPVSQLHVISRYTGGSENQGLHRLGSGTWEKAKRKAAEQAHDIAAELLNLYAQRAAKTGCRFTLPAHDYATFCASFAFEETPDQALAIKAVLEDMGADQPMDRLICGDVGFGKTEVALRAAFVAAMNGKQTAVLVPTTLLAEQHFQSFSDRFAPWPVKIAEYSRFKSTKENKAVLDGLKDGHIDIVIGTHKLIQPDIQFKDLGLVIIDEEHRFGVRQKEQLKQLRANVDLLTLTATPIPRTLSMALEGLRQFSMIATPPQRRLTVKTFISPRRDGLIREAILRELKRGGQVFFLHNDVDSIESMRDHLASLLPEARIAVAHGQLRAHELESVMRDFLHQRFNVLLCSTIIETGIDIANANTILINRADKFGLAQLHQLRGRVGRSHHQAYAYLLTPDTLSKDAKKRLEAIEMSEDLGSGFYLAMQDLEIRGAGEVLGEGQSGNIQSVGFSLFNDMLKQAVNALKQGKIPNLNAPLGLTTEVNLHSPALLPEDYCPDVHERLLLYKRLANTENTEELDELYVELIDRFGLPPQPVKTLIECHRLRLLAKPLGIQKLDASNAAIHIQFVDNPPIDPMHILQLIQNNRHYQLSQPNGLRIIIHIDFIENRIIEIKKILKNIATQAN